MCEKILSYYKDAVRLYNGGMVVPRMVSVWLSHCCNLNCDYCLYSEVNGEKILIDSEKFMNLIGEIKELGVEGLEFSGGGEPVMHYDCFRFAEYAKSLGLKVGMFTNGIGFDWSRIDCFEYIRVGLDTLDESSYRQIKGVGKGVFEKVLSNIENLLKVRKGKRPRIGLKAMVGKENYLDIIDKAIEFGEDLGVDYVHFRRILGDKGMDKDDLRHFLKELKEVKEVFKEFIYGSFMFEDLKEQCFMAPVHSVITARGDMLNCCYANKEEFVIGNVFKDNFKNVWFSDRHKEVVRLFAPDFCNKYTCRWRHYNNVMYDIVRDGKWDFSFI